MNETSSSRQLRTRLRELRNARGWTLTDVGKMLGTTPQTISRLETNVMTVSTDWLQKFADLFGVPVVELLSEGESQGIEVIGVVRPDGLVSPQTLPPLPIQGGVAHGIAVRLETDMGPFRAGSHVIAEKTEGRNVTTALGEACLCQTEAGTTWLAILTEGVKGRYTLVPFQGGKVQYDQALAFIAPVRMEVRFYG